MDVVFAPQPYQTAYHVTMLEPAHHAQLAYFIITFMKLAKIVRRSDPNALYATVLAIALNAYQTIGLISSVIAEPVQVFIQIARFVM